MIKKFLVGAKQIYLANKKPTNFEGDPPPIIELSLPVDVYWEVRDLFQQLDFEFAANADPATLQETQRQIYKKVAPWAFTEPDRQSLYAKSS